MFFDKDTVSLILKTQNSEFQKEPRENKRYTRSQVFEAIAQQALRTKCRVYLRNSKALADYMISSYGAEKLSGAILRVDGNHLLINDLSYIPYKSIENWDDFLGNVSTETFIDPDFVLDNLDKFINSDYWLEKYEQN